MNNPQSLRASGGRSGFTLIEVIVVIGVLGLIFGVTAFGASRILDTFASGSADAAVVDVLSTAARRARAGQVQSPWGVYFDYDETSRRVNEVVIFAGGDYATRDTTKDETFPFPGSVTLEDVSVSGSAGSDGNDHQVVFNALTGSTVHYGTITVEAFGRQRTISISPSGFITREL
jgi:prepilin-type N-terminal cleavage/methylation domain-containing protein